MVQDCIFCLQEAAVQLLSRKPVFPTDPKDCFVNPPCGCPHPGKEIQCEDCPYLEACLSNCKQASRDWKVGSRRCGTLRERLRRTTALTNREM